MDYPRRTIPSVSGLIAFEATARHLSFSRAAEELALTQGAVSKRVRQLETVLGFQLLLRNTNQVNLTELGQTYLGHARKLLQQLHVSTEDMRASARGLDAVRVAVPTVFASRWLVPRLTGFYTAFPRCSINLMSFCAPDDPRLSEADCIVVDGQVPWRDAQTSVLASGPNIIVASPNQCRDFAVTTPGDIADCRLLACNRTPDLWQRWFAAAGMPDHPIVEIRFDDVAVILEAACAGQGLALLPDFLVAEDLRAGRLREFFPKIRLGQVQYKLAVQSTHRSRLPVQNFVGWITGTQRPANAVGLLDATRQVMRRDFGPCNHPTSI